MIAVKASAAKGRNLPHIRGTTFMQPPDKSQPPIHPLREGFGFLSAAMAATARLFWPGWRHTPRGDEPIVTEAEPVDLSLTEKVECLAPSPIDE